MSGSGRFSCFLIGSDSLLLECAETLLARGHEILGVITDTARLASWAGAKGITVHGLKSDWAAALASRPFDWLFSITYLSVIPADVLRLPRRGAINFHDGPLPRYAGLNTPAWGLLNGEQQWGITFHLMTEAVDAGDVVARRDFPIGPRDTSLTLNARCFEAAMGAFEELVDNLHSIRGVPQGRAAERTYTRHQRPEAAGVLDWTKPAATLDATVRALDFGRYLNPLGSPKLVAGHEALIVTKAEPLAGAPGGPPGMVVSATDRAVEVATGAGSLAITGLASLCGRPVAIADVRARLGIASGTALGGLAPEAAARLSSAGPDLSRAERFWTRRLLDLQPPSIEGVTAALPAGAQRGASSELVEVPQEFRARFTPNLDDALVSAACVYLALRSGSDAFDIAYRDPEIARGAAGLEPVLRASVPLRVSLDGASGFDAAVGSIRAEVAEIRRRGPFLRDLVARHPDLSGRAQDRLDAMDAIGLERSDRPEEVQPKGAFTFVIGGGSVRLAYDPARVRDEFARTAAQELSSLLAGIALEPSRPLARRDLLAPQERARILSEWNATARPIEAACIHDLIALQARRTPELMAVACGGDELTYGALNARANRLAHFLRGLGVGPDVRVGVCVERSIDMLVAILGVLKSGGAYVPIDPGYPADRTRFVIEDADVPVLLTQEHLLDDLPKTRARVVCMDSDWPAIERQSDSDPPSSAAPDNLAYVIFTSGSTGKPKGVMVEHRNAVNFFAGMDERIPPPPHGRQGVWLAVTSLSFDISVLELLWTLARGYKIVLYTDPQRRRLTARSPGAPASGIQFSLFYFAADEGEQAADKYRLLLEGARFADRHGFSAVWTPERHFHAFGGLYPNPAVASAALAFATERVQLRAGSVVLPLHHPARVAEDWALVDNLSRGRVAVSFASGWQPVDFVLRPETYDARHKVLYENIEVVRRLWRGEAVAFPNATGGTTEVRTLPRPVQQELPIWITTAGSLDTWKTAAEIGANILTHLLGQTPEEIAEKIRVYREIYAQRHPGKPRGVVTIMLHTFVGDDDATVKETVRRPMISYLRSSLSLVKNVVSSWAAFKKGAGAGAMDIDIKTLSREEMDGLLEFSFERYYETSGLFGTVETCMKIVDGLTAIGVDEIACLVDFGVDGATALAHLEHLDRLRRRASRPLRVGAAHDPAESIGGLMARHSVTHFQCTPSMARMVLFNEEDAGALAGLSAMLIGGEALPGALARDLAAVTSARVLNMYGPTETTVWSSSHPVSPGAASVPIGRPIANTELYILDAARRPVPVGVAGELYIGGAGVVRGYLNRPELTAERFVLDPFSGRPGARLYRTGDLARWLADGTVEFLGRADHQVKVRGHRIELGEIEAAAALLPGVRGAAVVLREDTPGDQRLVAYVERDPSETVTGDAVKAGLRKSLPEYMLPSHVVFLSTLPLTPNKKIDRKALPRPDEAVASAPATPASEVEARIAAIWVEVLGRESVGVNDNFFDLGGHSLLAVKAHRRLKETFQRDLAITDLFRFPTVRALAAYVQDADGDKALESTARRADTRREMLARRRAGVRARIGGGDETGS